MTTVTDHQLMMDFGKKEESGALTLTFLVNLGVEKRTELAFREGKWGGERDKCVFFFSSFLANF